jgi:hypothetical protein
MKDRLRPLPIYAFCFAACLLIVASALYGGQTDSVVHGRTDPKIVGLPNPNANQLETTLVQNEGTWSATSDHSGLSADACKWSKRYTFNRDHSVKIDNCPSSHDFSDSSNRYPQTWRTEDADGDTWLIIGDHRYQVLFIPDRGIHLMQLREFGAVKPLPTETATFVFDSKNQRF